MEITLDCNDTAKLRVRYGLIPDGCRPILYLHSTNADGVVNTISIEFLDPEDLQEAMRQIAIEGQRCIAHCYAERARMKTKEKAHAAR